MKPHSKKVAVLAAAMVTLGALAGGANAAVVITFNEVDGNVTATASGTISLAGLFLQEFAPLGGSVLANPPAVTVGGPASLSFGYGTITGPGSIGSGGTQTAATSSSGDLVGITSFGPGFTSALLRLPQGYTSGSTIIGSSTWAGQSLSSLGLDVGTYVWNWGSGASADSLTINVNAGLSVPEPSTTLLFGLGALGIAVRRKRRRLSAEPA